MPFLIDDEVWERVQRLEVPFNSCGVDPYGISMEYVARSLSVLKYLYKYYFTVDVRGVNNVPARGRAMLIGNHSGGIAVDGAMAVTTCFFELEPPRLVQSMVEKFINRVPFASQWTNRTGQFTGLPEHAARLLHDERILLAFPEGARGTAKLFSERHSLVHFGTGFMRLALQTKTPIVPFGFVGGGDAVPTIANSTMLGKLIGAPYVPITPYGLAVPLPVRLTLIYSEPMMFEGTGSEGDEVIEGYVSQVRDRIAGLIAEGRRVRRSRRGSSEHDGAGRS